MDIQYNSTAQKYKQQGNQAYKTQDYTKALTLYSKAIEIDQQDPNYFSNRALCYFNLNRFQECIRDCDRAIKINPSLSKAFKKKAQACINLLRFQEALEAAKANVNIEKNIASKNQLQQIQSLKSNFDRYQAAASSEDFGEALSCVSYLVNKIPTSQQLKIYKVQCLAKQGNTSQALSLLNSISGNSAQLFYLRGIIQLYQGDAVKAKKYFSDGLKVDPGHFKCQKSLSNAKRCQQSKQQGNQLIKQQKYKEAEAKYTEAINLDPFNKKLNSVIFSNRGLCYMKLGQKIKALQDLNKSLELDPNYLKSLIRRAQLNMQRQDYTAALQDYSKIQELDPSANMKPKIQEAQKKQKQAKKKDYYAILGVPRNATQADIKKAYKTMAMKYHPDRNRGKSQVEQQQASKKFKDIAQAHGVLTDPEKKKMYDCGQMSFDGDMGSGGFQNMGGFFGGMGGGNGNVRFTFNGNDMGGSGIDPSEIFKMFFNGGGQDFGGFGGFENMRGGKKSQNKKGSSRFKGFENFEGFSNFGGFDKGGKFNF